MGKYLDEEQAKYPALNVREEFKKTSQFRNNEEPTPQSLNGMRKFMARGAAYLTKLNGKPTPKSAPAKAKAKKKKQAPKPRMPGKKVVCIDPLHNIWVPKSQAEAAKAELAEKQRKSEQLAETLRKQKEAEEAKKAQQEAEAEAKRIEAQNRREEEARQEQERQERIAKEKAERMKDPVFAAREARRLENIKRLGLDRPIYIPTQQED
jgi:hypothetical protein